MTELSILQLLTANRKTLFFLLSGSVVGGIEWSLNDAAVLDCDDGNVMKVSGHC